MWTLQWTLKISEDAQKFYNALKGKHQIQVKNGLDRLKSNPFIGKTLKGELKGYWSYRVGVYRILYSVNHNEILVDVLRIQHRKEVYERFNM